MASSADDSERKVAPEALGDALGALRLGGPEPVRHMSRSLREHGQLTAVAVYEASGGQLEVVDGFKRLHAARELRWSSLRVEVLAVDGAHAKAAMCVLNERRGLTELEEGWLCRSLYRDDRLTQPEIGRLLGRHKSWVCRRLLLVEALDEAVQADVRLGLLGASVAQSVARLRRRNQHETAQAVIRRGLTAVQTARLVAALLECSDEATRKRLLAGASKAAPPAGATPGRSAAEALIADARALVRVAARLQARLLAAPLSALGDGPAALAAQALVDLHPVLIALHARIEALPRKEPHAHLVHP